MNRVAETAEEKALSEVICSVLKTDSINMLDNFFNIGGDSIKAIYVVSELEEMGYKLHVADIMQNDTLSDVAKAMKSTSDKAIYDQDEVNGFIQFTPIMRAYLNENNGIKKDFVQTCVVAAECDEQNGLHIQDDHFYAEIIDPDTLENLPEGETGELVLTTLTKEGMPIIRFRTKDITSLNYDSCPCGRTTIRMNRITGRSDDKLKVKGVLVFPSQIESAILQVDGVTANYLIHITRPKILDEIEVKIEISPETFSDEMRNLETLQRELEAKIHSAIGIKVDVSLVEPESLPRSEGKAVRVIDDRNLDK